MHGAKHANIEIAHRDTREIARFIPFPAVDDVHEGRVSPAQIPSVQKDREDAELKIKNLYGLWNRDMNLK